MNKALGEKKSIVKEVPENWEIKLVGEIANISTGKKDTINKVTNGKYPFFVRSQTIERINSYSFDGEAVLTAGDGVGVGKVFHYINGKFDYHQRVYKISDFNDVNGLFFFYFFKSNFYKQIMKYNAKTSVDSVRLEMISKMEIAIPPIKEQIKIASIINIWDRAIELKEKLITQKKEQKKGLIQKLLSGKLRFTGFVEEWNKVRLENVIVGKGSYGINAPSTDKDLSLPTYLRITDISDDGYIIKDGLTSVDHPDSENYYLEKNDIVFARTGASTGRAYLYEESDGRLVYAGFLIKFQIDSTRANPKFIKYITQTEKYYNWVKVMSVRSGQPGINAEEYKQLPIFLPPLKEQQKIADILSDLDRNISLLINEVEELNKQKNGLMQKLLTGKVRVKV
ncbi:restriction endonuclease subunit S [Bacillus sp. FJAT-49736]|uniref:restriction endonuclease subunit S n=1 Tax=Bacillus sp. FJAT-49736 TaxID=2833582 RepID=UPI001BC91E41|nr:restriction endonuclease subunit S [Bacillus sp. FJAT-49736]MBS4171823.1 restriction endonuclease subunit S [Bacillus sp. FJAT-49736]